MTLTSLPVDIIVLIFPYLNAKEFLAFTSCHPSLLQYRQEPSFWRDLTRTTFRLPPQPLLEGDGLHWQRLYKSITTQSRVFSWGANSRGNLGQWRPPRRPVRGMMRMRGTSGWPQEMVDLEKVGIVSDVQCGGWSTMLLNARGELWAVGVLNGMSLTRSNKTLMRLSFPPAYPQTTSNRYEPSTAVRQFSVGRYRALALTDDHKIWEWSDFQHPGQIVKFFNIDNDPARSSYGEGLVTKVVAGWSKSSAYIQGKGIVYWSEQPDYEENSPTDAFIVHCSIIPGTSFRRDYRNRVARDSLDANVGEVKDFVFLDGYIMFTTHLEKLFAFSADNDDQFHSAPVELKSFYEDSGPCVRSINGSFLRFGVFTTTGRVLIGSKDLLDAAWSTHTGFQVTSHEGPSPEVVPALQNSHVVSLAFGDWHYHALHADGTVTSYGTESQACGSLGLGDHTISHLRGLFFPRRGAGDGVLRTPTWGAGRRTVWFEEEKEQWLTETLQKGATNEASPRARLVTENPATAELVGEWAEREGRDWEKGPNGYQEEDEDNGVASYFALKISAAGHSSAALVLVNQEKAAKIRAKYVLKEPSPQVGTDAPGQTILESITQWFLGRNESRAQSTPAGTTATEEMDSEETERARADDLRYNSTYVWDQEPFPRLRYPSGELMPGEVEPTRWKWGEPEILGRSDA